MPPEPTEVFRALCESRALRWRNGDIPAEHGGDGWIGYAVDPLQAWAERTGLVQLIGQDEVQRIMADAFDEDGAESRRRDLEYDPSGRRHGLKEPPRG